MPIQGTVYYVRFPLPDLIERGQAQTLEVMLYQAGAPVAPTAGTFALYRPGEDTACVSGSATIGTDRATFALMASDTSAETPGSNWRVEWTLTLPDGRIEIYRNDAALVLRRLAPVLLDDDLREGRYPDLDRYLPAGESSWQTFRDAAWLEIQRRLLQDQRRPWLIAEPSALLDAHRELTLARIFRSLGMQQRGVERDWLSLAEDHRREFERLWGHLSFAYDVSADDETGSGSRQAATPVVVLCATGADGRW